MRPAKLDAQLLDLNAVTSSGSLPRVLSGVEGSGIGFAQYLTSYDRITSRIHARRKLINEECLRHRLGPYRCNLGTGYESSSFYYAGFAGGCEQGPLKPEDAWKDAPNRSPIARATQDAGLRRNAGPARDKERPYTIY